MLRYFGIRAEIVDFGVDENGNYLGCNHSQLHHIARPSDAVCDVCGCVIKDQADGKSYCCVSCDYDLCHECHTKRKADNSSIRGTGSSDGRRQSSILSFVSNSTTTTTSGRVIRPTSQDFVDYVDDYEDENGGGWEKFSHLLNQNPNTKGSKMPLSSSFSKNSSQTQITSQLVDWLTTYFHLQWPRDHSPPSDTNEYYLPPLYFQHEGHSRTIVGLEDMNSKTSLIIFDPLSNGALLKKNMEESLASNNGKYVSIMIFLIDGKFMLELFDFFYRELATSSQKRSAYHQAQPPSDSVHTTRYHEY